MNKNYLSVVTFLALLFSASSSNVRASVTNIYPQSIRPYWKRVRSHSWHKKLERRLRHDEYVHGRADARYRYWPSRRQLRIAERAQEKASRIRRLLSHQYVRNQRSWYESDSYDGIHGPSRNAHVRREERELRSQLGTDLERFRQWHHLPLLQETDAGNRLADERAEQLSTDGFSHYDHNGRQWYLTDERQMHPRNYRRYYNSDTSENIAQACTDGEAYYHNGSQDIDYHTYNGYSAGNEVADMEVRHDQSEHNGHRKNILDPSARYLGIGVYRSPSSGVYEVAEELSQVRP